LSNHTSGEKIPLMSFDGAQDERDLKCAMFMLIYAGRH